MLEQTSLYQDLDGDDLTSYHLFLTPISKQATKKNRDIISSIAPSVAPVIAYGRLIPLKESSQPPTVRLGRIVVAPSYRRQGLGKELVIKLLKSSQKLFPHHNHLEISAQTSLIDFYQSFGFTIDSEPYLDGGIWHTTMRYS